MKEVSSATIISGLFNGILKNKLPRKVLQKQLDKHIREKILKNDEYEATESARLFRYYAVHAMYTSFLRNYDKGIISKRLINKVIATLVNSVMLGDNKVHNSIEKFQDKYNQLPPKFLTISPTNKCNLKCTGCYASSKASDNKSISWDLLMKIIEDAYINMGMRFFVVSGGEPLLYRSENKTILDLAKKWNDCFFLMYTNGTLINKEIASQMAEVGNITPAISIEGFTAHTDHRRGNGTFRSIIKAKDQLISYGIPFGLSITATKDNINLLLSENFYDFYFNEFGSTYMWVFQYMPIGREFTTDLMITPRQRVELFKIQRKILIEKKYFVADFWNSGIISNGCISCGKPKGYFYINWDGNIMPCVFVPHFNDNIQTLYNSGRNLSDALFFPLFVKGRQWQSGYKSRNGISVNLLMPCFYRDHYKDFTEIVKSSNAMPENQAAKDALNSHEYYKDMLNFDEQLRKISTPIWEEYIT